jgi:hypothetical protein
MCSEELSGSVCAINFEAIVRARKRFGKPQIVKGGGDVEQFRVKM